MRVRQMPTILSLILTVCIAASAQQAGRIESMKLLTPDVGWAATNKKLFWTTNGGAGWKDITPRTTEQRTIASVFFLDTLNGWAVLAYAGKENPKTNISDTLFELASTTDSGTNWSVQHLDVPDPDFSRGLSGEAWLDFVDSQHGWLLVRMNGSTAVSMGVLRATEDGGRTWKSLGVPAAGPIRFVTPTDGWMEGGPTEDVTQGVYVTRDGGRNWTLVTLKAPQAMGTKTYPTYQLPQFADKDTGFLLVTFSEPNDESPKLALFTTKDGGRTWTFGSAMTEGGSSWYTTAVGSDWLAAGCPGGKLALARATGGAMSVASQAAGKTEAACVVPGSGVLGVTFGDSSRGWLLLLSGRLLSTTDGGGAWRDITPAQAGRVVGRGQSTVLPVRSERIDGSPPARPTEPPSSNVSAHLGFDKFPVIPKTSDMQNWMNSSPFYDVGIYLPGSKNKSNDANLTPAWVSAAQGQGWGIMPLWFGLQSACSCYVDKTGKCVPFTYQISTNLTQAKMQGTNEATAAIAAARTLGLSPSVIYHDIENYAPDGSTCSLPVQAFLGGWDQQMQTVGKAGVYGNPAPAAQDFSKASPTPDDVWIAKYPAQGQPPQLTIWALGKLTDAPNWTNSQRIHQVQQNLVQAWGSTTTYKIDPDIENATIVATNGAKTYSSYTYTEVDYPGATETCAMGINNIWDTGLINGSGQVGQIVGWYIDSSGQAHGFLLDGLVAFTPIDYPGAAFTAAYGINNSGEIVGTWLDSNGANHGFLLSGGTYTSIDDPSSAGETFATAINDAEQIVGRYQDATNAWHSFLHYGSKFYAVDYPGGSGTYAGGINGDGVVAGYYNYPGTPQGFAEYALPPAWAGTFSSFNYAGTTTWAYGVNNDDQFTGYYPYNGTVYGFVFSNGVLLTSFQYPGAALGTYLFSTNDFAQSLGYYLDSSDNCHGFVAVPQS